MSVRVFWASITTVLGLAALVWAADPPAAPKDARPSSSATAPKAGGATSTAAVPAKAAAVKAKSQSKPATEPKAKGEGKAPGKPASQPKAQSAAVAEFGKVFTQWKDLIGKLAGLQLRYRSANDDQKLEIQQQWDELIAKGEVMEARLLDSAEKAYAAAPNQDKGITEYLTNVLRPMLRRDEYEPAARVGKLLMENHCDAKQLPALAGVAAFVVGDLAAAERYLKQVPGLETSLGLDKDHAYLEQLVQAFRRNPAPFERNWAKEQQIRENEANADNLPRVLLKTSKGDIELELFENEAPLTVGNFIYLVERKFYNGVPFHRVLPGFMAQGGDPTGTGTGGPGYSIPCECYKPNYRHHFRGSLSMAKAPSGGSDGQGRDTGGSQFFLTFVPTVSLDGHHTVFGRVIKGMDVLAKLQRRDPEDQEAPRPDKIIEAKVLRKRAHDYMPKKVEQ